MSTRPSFTMGIYATISTLNVQNGANPVNWLALLYPTASLVAGNIIGTGVDKIRSLSSYLLSKNRNNTDLESNRPLITTTNVYYNNNANSAEANTTANNQGCYDWVMRKLGCKQ